MIDLKCTLVMINEGSFKEYSKYVGKHGLAANITKWYYDKDWGRIEEYIRKEAEDFIRVYVILKRTSINLTFNGVVSSSPSF